MSTPRCLVALLLVVFSSAAAAAQSGSTDSAMLPPTAAKDERELFEWLLQIRMTPDQIREYDRLFTEEFGKKDAAARAKGVESHRAAMAWGARVQRLTPTEQDRERVRVIGDVLLSLVTSTDQDDMLVVQLCKAAHPELILAGQGFLALKEGATREAVRDFTQALRLTPKLMTALLARGITYLREHDYDHAIQDFADLLAIDADFREAYQLRSQAYQGKGDAEKARTDAAAAARLGAADPRAAPAVPPGNATGAGDPTPVQVNARPLTIEEVNANPRPFVGKEVTFRNVRIFGELHRRIGCGRNFTFTVVSANSKRFDYVSLVGDILFGASDEMAFKLAQIGLDAKRSYRANVTGLVGVMDNGRTGFREWMTFVTTIEFLDQAGNHWETVEAQPPSSC